MRDIGRFIKYLILGIIIYSYLFSGSILYLLMSILTYLISLITYPIRAMFADFGGFNIGLDIGSLYGETIGDTSHSTVQNVLHDSVQQVIQTGSVSNLGGSRIDYSTPIGKIIRALIGPY